MGIVAVHALERGMGTCLVLMLLFPVPDETTPGHNGINSAVGRGVAVVTDAAGLSRIIDPVSAGGVALAAAVAMALLTLNTDAIKFTMHAR